MEEVEIDEQHDDLYCAVREDQPSKVKILMEQGLDLYSPYGKEGSIISVAIKNADVEVLAELLGVEYPLKKETIVLPYEKHKLLNSPCDAEGLTPIMKSASCGRCDALSFLIACGAEVNAETSRHEAAIDFALRQADSNVALLLFKADAIISNSTHSREGKDMLNKFIAENRELQDFFDRRDRLHDALKMKMFNAEIEAAFENEDSLYYINRNGESAMWQAVINLNYEAWAYLNDKGVKCARMSEVRDVEIAKLSHEDNFNQSLVKYYFPIKGTHVMKMVSKAIVFRKKRRLEDLGGKVDSFFNALDQDEITAILLEVLQDENNLDVVFDFDSSNLEHVHPNLYGKVWGVMDPRRRRVYVSAQESENYTSVDLIRTLAHELAHWAISLVFQNDGKPYKKEDKAHEREYKEILAEVLSYNHVQSCDDIIKRVLMYDECQREQELIVRVPEMIARYQHSDSDDENCDADEEDGVDHLEKQAPRLLQYYNEHVMPAFQLYVEKNLTSNRLTVKVMSEYQKLLNADHCDQIEVCVNIEDFNKYIHCHNGLKILRVSNMRLGQSHLKTILKKKADRVLLIDWSQLIHSNSEFLEGLANRAIGFMVVTWDQEDDPPLCKKKRCRNQNCIANSFGGMFENAIVLLPMKCSTLKIGEPIHYKWIDLSEKTKELILHKKLVFIGEESTVHKLITAVANDDEVENFMAKNVCPSDISYLLEEKIIHVGKASGWSADETTNNNIFYHQDCYIKRSLCQGSVKLATLLLEEITSDIFVVSNATVLELRQKGVFGECVRTWNGLCAEDDVRCYILDSSMDMNDEDVIFSEICCQYNNKRGIHHLKFKGGDFLYIKSSGSVESLIKYMNYEAIESSITEDEFLHQQIDGKLLGATDDWNEISMPAILADDPGCGKSFIINSFASELRRKYSDVWITVIDLNFYAQSKFSAPLSELDSVTKLNCEEMIEFLYRMVRQGNSSFEKNLFSSFCNKRHKVIAMFDGFDEICPTYGGSVASYLEALKENTAIKVIVTTRLHEKYNLEKSLNSIAYKLVPFSFEEQVAFLDRCWNLRLKHLTRENRLNKMRDIRSSMKKWNNDEGDIIHAIQTVDNAILEAESELMSSENELGVKNLKSINFGIYAKNVLHGIKILSKHVEQFMHTPLHIQMTGFIAFEDDFNIGSSLNLGHLYQRFFEIKMKIFDVKKVISCENVSAEKYSRMARDRAYQLLEKLSVNIFFDPNYYKCKKTDMENTLSIGLVAEREKTYQFVHRTFGEFFFAKWLLRKSNKEPVTKFWLHNLFSNEGLFRVRCFLEDILYLQSIAVSQSEDDFSVEEKVLLNPSALPAADLSSRIHCCLFSIIINCQQSLLQYFVDAFGVEVVKLLLKDRNSPFEELKVNDVQECLNRDPINFLPIHLQMLVQLRISKPVVTCNAFTAIMMNYNTHGEKYRWIVKKMLVLIGEYGLAEVMSNMIFEHGLNWLLPSNMDGRVEEGCVIDLVSFLNGEHKEIFRKSLRKAFLKCGGIWECVYKKNIVLFDLTKSLSDGILDESELSSMFRKNPDFFKFWTKTLRYNELSEVRRVWAYVGSMLANKEQQLEFITKCKIGGHDSNHQPKLVNALTMAALNSDLLVINFVWELVMPLMNKKMYVDWLNQSFILGKPYCDGCLPRNIFKFMETLLTLGNLSEDDVVDLMLSKDNEGKCYFMSITNGALTNDLNLIFYFYNLLSCSLKNRAGDILKETRPLFWAIITGFKNDKCCQTEDLCSEIEEEFKNIVSCEKFGLVDLIGTMHEVKDFEFRVVLYYKALKLESECLGREHLFERIRCPQSNDYVIYSNVLSYLICWRTPFMLSFICAILIHFIKSEDMIQFLFMVNKDGNNVFHEAANYHDYYNWGKLYDVARILVKEKAFSEIHTIENKFGECVHDLFLKSSLF